jgi:hypothetical protein
MNSFYLKINHFSEVLLEYLGPVSGRDRAASHIADGPLCACAGSFAFVHAWASVRHWRDSFVTHTASWNPEDEIKDFISNYLSTHKWKYYLYYFWSLTMHLLDCTKELCVCVCVTLLLGFCGTGNHGQGHLHAKQMLGLSHAWPERRLATLTHVRMRAPGLWVCSCIWKARGVKHVLP